MSEALPTPQTAARPGVVVTEEGDGILVVRLNRPDRLNAIDRHVAQAISAAVTRLEESDHLRVGIITGEGRAFTAGADLTEVAAGDVDRLRTAEGGFAGFVRRRRTKPWIAAVNGLSFGGGVEISLACDLVVAATEARFALPEVKRGLVASAGGVLRLVRAIPPGKALGVLLTGEPVTAEELERWGLVWKVVPAESVLDEALALARSIGDCAPLAVQTTLALGRTAAGLNGDAGDWLLSDLASDRLHCSADAREGAQAFLESRAPRWRSR